ncbi:MAG: insulinase family protein [Bdellovibrionales bacterium]|nr:insulinase family protein [Bdellovibrionales bacterium]
MRRKAAAQRPSILLLPDKSSPLVFVDFALTRGSFYDPPQKAGLASLTLSLMFRGTQRRSNAEFHRALDNLGAEMSLGKFKESLRIYGVVLAEKVHPFLDLLEEMILEPRFPEDEFVKLKDQFRSALLDELGSDDDIAERRFQEYLLYGHPYGLVTSGSLASLERITLDDVKQFHAKNFRAPHVIFAATGGFASSAMRTRMSKILARMPKHAAITEEADPPEMPRGRHLLLLNKPDRTQSQILIGTRGVSFRDPDYLPMAMANHVFGGGSFSARLMTEVRVKRGWSYGAYSWFRSGRVPMFFAMSAVPSNKDTAACVKLMLDLYESFARKGITKKEFSFARTSLLNQSAFLQDTLRKRLENKVTEKILGLPAGFYDSYVARLRRVTHAQVVRAVRRQTDPKSVFALVLGSAEAVESELKGLEGFPNFHRRSFDEEPVALFLPR